jgi:hypothetical protein
MRIPGKDVDRQNVVAAPPQAVTMARKCHLTTAMATTKSGALAHRLGGDILQGDIASTRQANAQGIQVACQCIAVVQPRV